MARYINADRFDIITSQRHSEDFIDGMDYILDMIDKAPTEDVLPRSEVEKYIVNMNAYGLTAKRLAEENEQLKELIKVRKSCQEKLATKHGMTVIELEQAKQEVAREIFEEIVKLLIFNTYEIACISKTDLAELKKKYIGE